MQIFNKFRNPVKIDIKTSFQKFLTDNYPSITFDKIQNFISNFQETRDSLENFKIKDCTQDTLSKYISNSLRYIKLLLSLEGKLNFSQETGSVNIKFKWVDSLSGKETSSYDIAYEISSAYFNLAILYIQLASINLKLNDNEKLKESMINFEKAAYCFKAVLKNKKEKMPNDKENKDFDITYLSNCTFFCLGMAEATYIRMEYTDKKPYNENTVSYAYGVCYIFNKIIESNDEYNPFKNTICKFYRSFYEVLSYYYKSNLVFKEFQTKCKGIGLVIGLGNESLAIIKNIEPLLKNVEEYFDTNIFNEVKNHFEETNPQYTEDNVKTYRDGVLTKEEFPRIVGKFDIVEPPKKLDDQFVPIDISELDELNSDDKIKEYVDNYTQNINEYVEQQFNELENEDELDNFISKNYNEFLNEKENDSSINLSDEVFSNLQEIKNQGGFKIITDQITEIKKNHQKYVIEFETIVKKITTEEQEHEKCKKKYGHSWNVPPVQSSYMKSKENYTKTFESGKKVDLKLFDDVDKVKQYFDIVNLPKDKIEHEICKKNNKLIDLLKKELDKLKNYSKELKEEKEKIINIKDKIPYPDFPLIDKKLTNEDVILDKTKKSMSEGFNKLKELSKNIKDCSNVVTKIINKIDEENKDESKSLNQDLLAFINDCKYKFESFQRRVNKGKDFYNNLNTRVSKLESDLESYLFARHIETNELIERLDKVFAEDRKYLSKSAFNK